MSRLGGVSDLEGVGGMSAAATTPVEALIIGGQHERLRREPIRGGGVSSGRLVVAVAQAKEKGRRIGAGATIQAPLAIGVNCNGEDTPGKAEGQTWHAGNGLETGHRPDR